MTNLSKTFQKISKILIVLLAILLILVIWSYFFGNTDYQKSVILEPKIGKISVGNSILYVEIADNDFLRTRGLSGRKNLSENAGMLFIFENSGRHGFWMKEMNFPIDIIWLNQDFKIVTVEKNAKPETYPTIFYPEEDARYVLEVNAGFSEKTKIKIGDKLEVISE